MNTKRKKVPVVCDKIRRELGLSKQQTVLMECLKMGMSNRQIAAALAVTDHTVKVHFHRLGVKLKLNSRGAMLVWYLNNTVLKELETLRASTYTTAASLYSLSKLKTTALEESAIESIRNANEVALKSITILE